jgi:hypothetical protein
MVFTEPYIGVNFGITKLQHGLHCSRAAQMDTPMLAYHKTNQEATTLRQPSCRPKRHWRQVKLVGSVVVVQPISPSQDETDPAAPPEVPPEVVAAEPRWPQSRYLYLSLLHVLLHLSDVLQQCQPLDVSGGHALPKCRDLCLQVYDPP